VKSSIAAPQRPIKRGPGKRTVDGRDFSLADEVRHIRSCAARHDGGIVTIERLILYSTQTGDAWLLDAEDQLAAQLARDGDREPIDIKESETNFTIDWQGSYRIEGATFIYNDRKRSARRAILGYPTQKLEHAARVA